MQARGLIGVYIRLVSCALISGSQMPGGHGVLPATGVALDQGPLTFTRTGISTGKTWSVHGGPRRTATPFCPRRARRNAENTFLDFWSPQEGPLKGRPYGGCDGAAFGTLLVVFAHCRRNPCPATCGLWAGKHYKRLIDHSLLVFPIDDPFVYYPLHSASRSPSVGRSESVYVSAPEEHGF